MPLHAQATELGMTARALREHMAVDAAVSIWGREFKDLPVKVKREIGLCFSQYDLAWGKAIDLMVREDAGPVEGAADLRSLLRRGCPRVGESIVQARALLGNGWSAQAVAGELRKSRLEYEEVGSPRGTRQQKETRAVLALWNAAQQRALTIADANEDVTELATRLLRRAAGDDSD